jgi:hypothetical protein
VLLNRAAMNDPDENPLVNLASVLFKMQPAA